MPQWVWITGVGAASLLVLAAAAVALGAAVWRGDSARAVARLQQPDSGRAPAAGDGTESTLPPPVARYFAYALAADRRPVRTAHVRWMGEFRMRPDAAWVPFTATQDFSVNPPGFVWDARIRMLPFMNVRVRDCYRAGAASMLGRLAGVIPVVDQAGTPELAQSALGRWLGEAAWFPTALLPRPGVQWEAIDDSTARVTLTDGSTTVSAEFRFAADGRALRMTSMRYRDVDGTPVLTPFEGVYGDYVPVNGVMIPSSAEVAWLTPEGRYAYWRGAPVEVRYQRGDEPIPVME